MRLNFGRIGLRVKALLGIIVPMAAFFSVLALTNSRSLVSFGLGLAALSVVIFAGINRTFVAPLNRLREAIPLVEEGRFKTPLSLRRRDELGELAESIAAMCDRLQQHSTLLFNISKVTSSTIDLEQALKMMLENAAKVTRAAGGFIMLAETFGPSGPTKLKLKTSLGIPAGRDGRALVSEEIAAYVAERGGPLLLVGDIIAMGFQRPRALKDAVYAPIRFGNKTIGVISLINKQSGDFNKKDLQLLLTLANQASGVINGARLLEDLQASYLSTVRALSAAIDAKDPYTRGHSGRVVKYCQIIAAGLGYSEAETEAVKIAAYLHDIGKIGIDEQILSKPYKLNAQEYDEVKRHSSISAKILARATFLQNVIPLVRHHHERFDGRGYPDGLAGADIPMGARIILVADSFDAMTSRRPYRQALGCGEALEELRRCSGTQFDTQVVEIFIKAAATLEDGAAAPVFI